MELKPLENFKAELTKRLEVSHPGDLQIQIGDKLLLYYAEEQNTNVDDDGNEFMERMFMSVEYYGEHHEAMIYKLDGELRISYTEGDLSDKLWDFIEDELSEYIQILWDAVEKWQWN